MRLRKIILSGFKSFVDHTVIDFPSDLVAIVGPNGCGKSNVIDAVRWVMGEISARHLRGDSMADVIFNGSTSRKPVGKATVELQFDNSEGRLGERYAAYTDIAVKRQVTRDGSSTYFLNGTRCRRRDITDLFLGTGLGPRSYAVIEQGMISRIIEARPEELREYLEEVAGISRYKERRRETENRMRHTREHLERLTDVREELDKQLQRLDRQARQAERYKGLKAEERVLEGQLLALRWRRFDGEVASSNQEVLRAETQVEGATADLRNLEVRLEQGREGQSEAAEVANTAYRRVLEVSATVARTEESIDSLKRQRAQVDEALTREREALTQAESHRRADETQLGEVMASLQDAEPRMEQFEADAAGARQRYTDAETAMQQWQSRWEELAQLAEKPSSVAHAERARAENFEERLQRAANQEATLRQELEGLAPGAALARRDEASEQLTVTAIARDDAGAALAQAQDGVAAARETSRENAANLHSARERDQRLQGTLASLTALQEEALGANDNDAITWLTANGLADAGRLAQSLEVEPGWERAVEVVLGTRLEAVAANNLDALAQPLVGFSAAELSVYSATSLSAPSSATASASHGFLTAQVRGPQCVTSLIHGARTAPDLAQAQAALGTLGSGEYFVLPSGVRLGQGWMHVPGPEQARDGVLARAQRLRELGEEVTLSRAQLDAADEALREAQAVLKAQEEHLSSAQITANERHRQYTTDEAAANEAERQVERIVQRQEKLESELSGFATRREEDKAELAASRQRLGEATGILEQVERDREIWAARRDETRAALQSMREGWQRSRDESYQLGLQVEGWRSRRKALEESRLRYTQERSRLERHCAELGERTEAMTEPLAGAEISLQDALAEHAEAEAILRDARQRASAVDTELRQVDSSRQKAQGAVETARNTLEQTRLATTQNSVRRDAVKEQIDATEQVVEALVESLPEDASEKGWEQQIEDMARRVSRLGAINLAAIEEHQETGERKTYLDAQNADLEEALATLDSAIARIDKETRARFKETFEKVNRGLSERFPKLFGGGQAYLQMSGEDLLNAGVSVMAQPPGKRNSTIALLSGGEKALTAVALVFALFDLNPAPFCLLDEVDAPLDDANVTRFSKVVQEMSEHVQMLVVTHNKVTMEIGQQLVGVTMNEPGVSRTVAVDIDAAMAFVDG